MKLLIRFFRLFLRDRADIKAECAETEGLVSTLRSCWRWRQVRNAFVVRNPECRMCLGRNDLEVHHILPWQASEELRYADSNLITLCRDDHFRYGHWRNWRGANPDIEKLADFTAELRGKQ